jgi:hypothetical protein
MNAVARCEEPWGELEKTGTSIETGTTPAVVAGVCPTFSALAFRRSADEKRNSTKEPDFL